MIGLVSLDVLPIQEIKKYEVHFLIGTHLSVTQGNDRFHKTRFR